MAISKGVASTEKKEVKRFIGVGSVSVLAINPDKKTLETIYDAELTSDPIYLGKGKVKDREVDSVRIDFIVKNDETGMITKVAFFLKNSAFYNHDNTKVQMINKYGESCWLTIEDAKNKITPSFVSPDGLRAAKIGELEIIDFIKAWANIKNRVDYNTKMEIDDIENAECCLDKIDNLFKGDFRELNALVKALSTYKVKVLFGVKNNDGKLYQDAFVQKVSKNGAKKYDHIEKVLVEAKKRGAYADTVFEICNIKPYDIDVDATTFKKAEDTFGSEDVAPAAEEKGSDDLPF